MIYGFKEGPRLKEANRIGTKEQGKNRPIKIEVESASKVDSILMQARNLEDFTEYEDVYLGPDRTKSAWT